jgi:hypothetical protein
MTNEPPMFADDADDPYAMEIVKRLLGQGIPEEEIDRHLQAAFPDATAKAAAHLLEQLKATSDQMFADRRNRGTREINPPSVPSPPGWTV